MNNIDYITRDSYSLRYVDMGNKELPPIFVIGSSIYYSRLFNNSVYQDLHLVFLDHRGASIPENTKDKYNLETIVQDIDAIREVLNYDEVFLLGHSYNAFLAMEYAKTYTDKVLGLILSNTTPNKNEVIYEKNMAYFLEHADDERKSLFERDFKKYNISIELNPDQKFSLKMMQLQTLSFVKLNFDSSYLYKNIENNINALDFLFDFEFPEYDTLGAIDYLKDLMPVLLILGEQDYFSGPISHWDSILDKTKIPLFTLENSGTNPMFEEPQMYFAILQDFTS